MAEHSFVMDSGNQNRDGLTEQNLLRKRPQDEDARRVYPVIQQALQATDPTQRRSILSKAPQIMALASMTKTGA